MRKIISKIAGLALGLSLVVGSGVALSGVKKVKSVHAADSLSYTLDFKANASDTDSSAALGETVADYFADGASYVTSLSSSKVYLGKSSMNGIKFGSSSAKGSLTLTLASSGQVKATKIVLALAVYDADKKVNVSINGASSGTGYSEISPGASLSDYEVSWDGETSLSTIAVESNIASKCRFYLDYIKVYVSDGAPVCEHNWEAVEVHAPTCTEPGHTEYECSLCGETKEEVVDALGHNFVNGVCTVCGAEEPSTSDVTFVFSDIASANNWENGIAYTEYTISPITVTAEGGGNNGKWYTSGGGSWRMYSGGVVRITAADGYSVESVTSSPSCEFTITNGEATFSPSARTDFTEIVVSYSGSTPSGSTYSVIYNKNESSTRPVEEGMPSNVSNLEDGATCTLTGSPTRWGYTFLGWGASASATETISSVTIDGSDETVYALWQEDHTVAGAWSDSAYTVAQARTAIDNNTHLSDVYVSGIISQVDSYNSTYKSITYWISNDGSTSNQFEVYSGKGINGADFSAVGDVEVGAQVVVNGTIKKYNSVYEFDKTSKQISYVGPSTGDIEVTFTPPVFLGVGDSGTYSASTDAENPTYSFSSSNSNVLSVASNGAYSAIAAGTATVRVDVTSSDGDGYKEVAVTVTEVKTVSEAYEIAAALSSGATTDYSIKVTGAISSLDADGKARAINFTDGAQVIEVFFGGGNADYTTVSSTGFIGSKVTVFGKVQNYSGTYELKDITLVSVVTGDADSYAAGAYKSLDGSCETGPDAVTEDQWTAVSDGYSQLSGTEQAKFRDSDLTPHGENVINWIDRYSRIVSSTEMTNFMSLSNIAGSRYAFQANGASQSSTIIIVVVALTSISSIGVLLVIKRKRSLVK